MMVTTPHPRLRRALLVAIVVLTAILVALLAGDRYLIKVYRVSGSSMEPALRRGHVAIAYLPAYHGAGPRRGDVVVFRLPQTSPACRCVFMRRVVGLPGETLALRDGALYVDGRRLDEPYLGRLAGKPMPTHPQPGTAGASLVVAWSLQRTFTVPAGAYYVLADQRSGSADSRLFGPVPRDCIVGKVIWP